MRRVVITGLGVVSPAGIGKEAFWQNLLDGVSGAVALDKVTCSPLFGHHEFGAQAVCEVSSFDPVIHQVPTAYHSADRFIQFAFAAAHQAFLDAHLDQDSWDASRVGITLATAICGTQTLDLEFTKSTNGGKEAFHSEGISPFLYSAAMGNSAALAVGSRYGFQGECVTLSTGCIAGLDAISYAYESIAYGDHDVMIAGASEAPITPITIAAFDIINCLSHHSDPTAASRPFSVDRDGFVLSEGCGIVVLEELEHALARHAPIYAEITGCDVTEHAVHMTDMSPEGRDLARAITGALGNANIEPQAIDFVNAHGTSTPQNDYFESLALKTSLGQHALTIPVNSTKSMVGHALAAASAVEVVACAMSMQAQRIHPTINLVNPDPRCDLDYVPNHARFHPIQRMLTTASGFSGLHAAMVLESYATREE
ncbi:putative polyketide beta-ketoacyl synthase 1 [Ktedonobacter sp. SOSP1-52]|uniref:beta-ketoacyl-[acyl-carrier-protein] synthase family protein n=1 Tax=Ktedonobacter sp. SOSP1-52 TaxID=2778366 RepID=UPI001915E930|nr:beta-ketoacyl-[acyl-carrier-protein] synthase family protein [Ktedonobacter sp. SOSP1-52]GHO61421.1 putative polyketide beta-ketoacyl synthase 1 [Ktedonobacter sp. SOSP1-52]